MHKAPAPCPYDADEAIRRSLKALSESIVDPSDEQPDPAAESMRNFETWRKKRTDLPSSKRTDNETGRTLGNLHQTIATAARPSHPPRKVTPPEPKRVRGPLSQDHSTTDTMTKPAKFPKGRDDTSIPYPGLPTWRPVAGHRMEKM